MSKKFISLFAPASLWLLQASEVMAAGDGHEKSGGLPQLDPSSYASQAFWLVAVFFVLYVFFSKKTLPDMSQTIEGRSERIKNDLDTAERVKNEVEEVQKNYNEALDGARQQSAQTFKDIETDIKERTDKFNVDFADKTQTQIIGTEKKIDKARKEALKDMEAIAATVAANAATKIIGVKADSKSIDAVVKSVSKAA